MSEEPTKETRLASAKDVFLSPIRAVRAIRSDRYKSLKVRIFFTVGTLAGVPLLIVTAVCFFWLHAILMEDFSRNLRWQMEHAQEGLERFLHERTSSLRFIAAAYSYDFFAQQQSLRTIFRKRHQEFPELMALEVIDAQGNVAAHAGLYSGIGAHYAQHDWFIRAKVHGMAISQVFPGERDLQHYIVAIRQDIPGRDGFWVLRATFDIETLNRFIGNRAGRAG